MNGNMNVTGGKMNRKEGRLIKKNRRKMGVNKTTFNSIGFRV